MWSTENRFTTCSSPPKAVLKSFLIITALTPWHHFSTTHDGRWLSYIRTRESSVYLYKAPTLRASLQIIHFLHFLIFKLRYGFLNVSYIFTVTYQPLFPFDLTKPLISFLWSRLNTIKTWQWLKKIQYAPLISQYGKNKINTGKHSFLPQEFHHDSLLSVHLYRHLSKQRRCMANEQMRKYQDLFLKSIK